MNAELLNLVTAITSSAGLILVIIGWRVALGVATKQAKEQLTLSADYQIYQSVLVQVNDIIRKISHFNTGIESHTKKMASILEKTHSNIKLTDKEWEELKDLWHQETKAVVESGFAIEESIVEFMRSLDMSGTNFHSETEVYKALATVQQDAFEAIESINRKWINLNLAGTTVPQYNDLKADTQRDLVHVKNLGACSEDILKLVYNDTIAKNTGKPQKGIDKSEKRKMITSSGLVDNRSAS